VLKFLRMPTLEILKKIGEIEGDLLAQATGNSPKVTADSAQG